MSDKLYRQKIIDESYTGRINLNSKIGEISSNAMDFVNDLFNEFEDMPIFSWMSIISIKGFEEVKPIEEIAGQITVHASVDTISGRTILIDIPIPIYKGEFYRPSMIFINSRRILFSEGNINMALPNNYIITYEVENQYSADNVPQRVEQAARSEFSSLPGEEPNFDSIFDYRGLS